ncbi:hypothetical protein B0H13DRAFT_1910018 [Mycena leptocephala]|nr:hypothetical protein B0H13DRAFT_1910018 [Mycena leptocephala]
MDLETGFTLIIRTAGETEDASSDEEEAEEAEDRTGEEADSNELFFLSSVRDYCVALGHSLKDEVNELGCLKFAEETGQTLTYFYADDKLAENSGTNERKPRVQQKKGVVPTRRALTKQQKQDLWEAPPCTSDHIPGKLSFLTKNTNKIWASPPDDTSVNISREQLKYKRSPVAEVSGSDRIELLRSYQTCKGENYDPVDVHESIKWQDGDDHRVKPVVERSRWQLVGKDLAEEKETAEKRKTSQSAGPKHKKARKNAEIPPGPVATRWDQVTVKAVLTHSCHNP